MKVGDRVSGVGYRRARSLERLPDRPAKPALYVMRGDDAPLVVMDDDEPLGSLSARTPPVVRRLTEPPRVHAPARREIRTAGAPGHRHAPGGRAHEDPGGRGRASAAAHIARQRTPLHRVAASRFARDGRSFIVHGGVLVVKREEWPAFLVADESGTAAVEGQFSILLDADDAAWAHLPASVYSLLEGAERATRQGVQFSGGRSSSPAIVWSVVGRPSLNESQGDQFPPGAAPAVRDTGDPRRSRSPSSTNSQVPGG